VLEALGGLAFQVCAIRSPYQAFVNTSKSDSIDLADVNGVSLKKLLECDAILGCLSSCDTNAERLESLPDGSVAKDIVRIGWFC